VADRIQVTGLKELRKELKAADAAFPKELQKANKKIAELVADGTRAAFSGMGGSAPKVAPTVKALAQQARAQVKVGGGSGVGAEVAMGNLWGSKRYKQFPPPVDAGYALYPTLKAKNDEIVEAYGDLLDDLLKRAFPD
jgi:hypothetical protein